ncbi:MAG: hypothetical protein JWN70_2713 [Planctomycetaceae bacterium]|nr:hypothetical protein [Planctomycetaceae bacterium]
MTAQIPDRFQYRGVEYEVLGVSNAALFDSFHLEFELAGPHTACWRGYQAFYQIIDHQLVLDALLICPATEGPGVAPEIPPTIHGIRPTFPMTRLGSGLPYQYDNLQQPLDYSGGVLVGDGFIQELTYWVGNSPAWHFTNVFELIFYRGILVEEFDRTAAVAEIRRQAGPPRGNVDRSELLWGAQLDRFIQRSFAADYRM